MRALPLLWCLSFAGVAAGCSEAVLELRLNQLADDHPFDELAAVEMIALVDGRAVERNRSVWDGGRVALGPVTRHEDMELHVIGYDADEQERSRGEVRPTMPARGGACCVVVCFCSLPRFRGGECTCGSDECRDLCLE